MADLFRFPADKAALAARAKRRFIWGMLGLALLAAAPGPAGAADYDFVARFDWRSEGEIYQVWFHREFRGRLVQTAPIAIAAADAVRSLLEDVHLDCTAWAKIGLPNWSATTGTCVLSNARGSVTIDVVDCLGTQKQCQGQWQIIDARGSLAGLTGSGTAYGILVEPDPLPWLWNGPIIGYNELHGVITIP